MSNFDKLFNSSQAAGPATAKEGSRPDARKEVRVQAKWSARVLLPDNRVVPLRTQDISQSGLSVVCEGPITSHAVLRIALAVPDLDVPGRFHTVTGSFRTAHVTVSGLDLVYGGTWVDLDQSARDLIGKWVRKLR